jgi:D-arginine dehydrogenase
MIFDVAIIGAGIAGASHAAEIGPDKTVLLLEQESQPGYHSTGRSAAFWSETYGGPAVQPLTSASGPFLSQPPIEFSERPLMVARGALHLGQASESEAASKMLAAFSDSAVRLQRLEADEISTYIKGLRAGWNEALWEPNCCDIDVAALHAAYLKKARKNGAKLVCDAPLAVARFGKQYWQIEAGGEHYSARILVNAAGAWADVVAERCGVKPIGIAPLQRTIMQLAVDPPAPETLPLIVGMDGSFYFKPEAGGRLWLSPHDEISTEPCDAAPAEMDIALAIDRFQQVVDWKIIRLERKWAGLRSFAADRLPVIGPDPDVPEFFWLAGQGGFGIQTAPAIASLAASILLERPNPLTAVSPSRYAPARLR